MGTGLNPSSWACNATANVKQRPRRPAFATFLGHLTKLHIIVHFLNAVKNYPGMARLYRLKGSRDKSTEVTSGQFQIRVLIYKAASRRCGNALSVRQRFPLSERPMPKTAPKESKQL